MATERSDTLKGLRYPMFRRGHESVKMRAFLVLAAVGVLVLAVPSTAADAEVPTHDVGDKVGFGTTIDLGAIAAYLDLYDQTDENITINEREVDGSIDIWATMEVVEESAEAYTIRTVTATGVRLDFLLDVTSTQFPAAGTYPGDMSSGFCMPPDIPVTTMTAVIDVDFEYLATSVGDAKWTVSNFALMEDQTASSYDFLGTFRLTNAPSLDFNFTSCEFTVAYEDHDLTASTAIEVDTTTTFSPALDVFHFPIMDGEVWSANASATTGGTIQGTIDVGGLDPEAEAAFFTSLNEALESMDVTVSGLDGFPIVLENVSIVRGSMAFLEDGVIHDMTSPVDLALVATERSMPLSDGNEHTVYVIAQGFDGSASPCGWVYSPDHGFVVGFRCEGISLFDLRNVPADEAERRITDTEQAYAVGPTGSNPNALADFFLKPPFLGILFVAAVAILAVALVMRRRKKPAMAPPGPAMPPPPVAGPPQSPPPGPP